MSTAWERPFWDCYCTTCTVEPQRRKKRGEREGERERKSEWERKVMEGGITLYSGSSAPTLLLPLSVSWRVWLRDRPTQLRAIQPSRSYAPDLLSKPPKLDYWDPRSKAYITSTCETLAGLITLNGNAGQIKAGWPVCTLSMPTDGWWKATWASVAETGEIVGGFPFWAPIGPRV